MSAYQAARAAAILGLESLPDRLTVEEIATLLVHDDWYLYDYLATSSAFVRDTWHKAMRAAIDAGELQQTDGKITATEFKRWLDIKGEPPSSLIQGWFALHAPEPKAPEPKAPEQRKKWTDEELARLRAFRDQHSTKAAAEKFGISESRVRQLLSTERPCREPDRPKLETVWNDSVRKRKA